MSDRPGPRRRSASAGRVALLAALTAAAPMGGSVHAARAGTAPALVGASLAARAARFPRLAAVNADFAQEREVSLVQDVLRASGRLSLAAPRRMRLELREPERLTLIADGSAVTILDAHDQPLPLPAEFAGFTELAETLTALLLEGHGPAAFDERWDGPDAVTLIPRSGSGPFAAIDLRFSSDGPLPETIVLREHGGDRTTIRLRDVHVETAPAP